MYVIVDTLLPYSNPSKKFLFSHNGSNELFWVALLEKAYAKLHQNYSHLKLLSFEEILVDLCNCHVSYIDLTDKSKTLFFESQKLFHYLINYVKGKEPHFVACVNENKENLQSNQIEMGEYGILRNFMHSIVSLEDIQKDNLKFLRLRNFWGFETNWSGPYSKNSDELDKYKNLRDLLTKNYSKDPQNIYFIKYEYFIKEFSKIYLVKLFEEEQWQNFCYQSSWKKKTMAGPPQDLTQKFPPTQRVMREFTQIDSDSSWFNNPQFRIKVFKKTKVYISLCQHDQAEEGIQTQYHNTNFYLFKNHKGSNRIWEFPEEDKIVLKANSSSTDPVKKGNMYVISTANNHQESEEINQEMKMGEKSKRELSQQIVLDVFEGKKSGNYTLIVNLEEIPKQEQVDFYIKLFANSNIIFEKLPQTLEYSFQGQWSNESAGGPYFQFQKPFNNNPEWCLNPQYLINFKEPTLFKVILQKVGKNAKKLKNVRLGLSYIYLHNQKNIEYYQIESKKNNQPLKTQKDNNKTKIFKTIQQYLNIPKLETFQRKIMIQKEEKFVQSTYASSEIACLFVKLLPIEGPLLIVPSLERQGL